MELMTADAGTTFADDTVGADDAAADDATAMADEDEAAAPSWDVEALLLAPADTATGADVGVVDVVAGRGTLVLIVLINELCSMTRAFRNAAIGAMQSVSTNTRYLGHGG